MELIPSFTSIGLGSSINELSILILVKAARLRKKGLCESNNRGEDTFCAPGLINEQLAEEVRDYPEAVFIGQKYINVFILVQFIMVMVHDFIQHMLNVLYTVIFSAVRSLQKALLTHFCDKSYYYFDHFE